jgi:hypothetical protein
MWRGGDEKYTSYSQRQERLRESGISITAYNIGHIKSGGVGSDSIYGNYGITASRPSSEGANSCVTPGHDMGHAFGYA